MPENNDWRILVVDDEPDIRDIVRLTLTDAGFSVATAGNGEEGLAQCSRFAPHIVITDIRMPGMDGLAVLKYIKNHHPRIEVIVATAFGDLELAIRCLQLDASDFITKPIDANALMVSMDRARQRFSTRRKLEDYTHFLEEGWNETTRELLETFKYQQKLIESSMDGILGCDAAERVVTYNQSMQQMFGYSKSQVLHTMKLDQFFDPHALQEFRCALRDEAFGGPGCLFLYETQMQARDGNLIPVQLSATLLMEQTGCEGLVCFISDLGRLRRLERQMADQARILHQDKMMSLGRLAASVAHELNNPLSGVLNYLGLMAHMLGKGPIDAGQTFKFQRYLETVEKEIRRCAGIVSNLLTFARKSPAVSEPVIIKDLLERCIVLSRHRMEMSNIELVADIQTNLPPVDGDPNQLQQCLINLIFNAIDAMTEGGRLELRAGRSDDGRRVVMTISDNGCGIAESDLPHIFEPFFTTKQDGKGTGLGLSTTFGIIERHQGRLDVSSREGRGTTFTIQLPPGSPKKAQRAQREG